MTVIRAMQQLNVSLKSSRPNDIFVVQGYFTYDWHNEWMRSTNAASQTFIWQFIKIAHHTYGQ